MGEALIRAVRQAGWRRIAQGGLFALVGLCSLAAQAEQKEIYLYRENGQRVFTDRKPGRAVSYSVLKFGRPTATASCNGVSEKAMQVRATAFDTLVDKHATMHGVPATLVRAVMRVESCFDQRAISRVGARGLMQLMPQTASELGVRDSFDADQNIGGGVRYLKMMLERFNQNTKLALAAYNAGPNAVDKHRGIPPFRETQNYVRRVLAAYNDNNRYASNRKTSG